MSGYSGLRKDAAGGVLADTDRGRSGSVAPPVQSAAPSHSPVNQPGRGGEQPAHSSWTGRHTHIHPAADAADSNHDGLHEHEHEHHNDADHLAHSHVAIGKSQFPGIDALAGKARAEQSVAKALIAMANAGQLGQLERDIRALRVQVASGYTLERTPTPAQRAALAKAASYRAKADAATVLADRLAYTQLAKAAEAAGR